MSELFVPLAVGGTFVAVALAAIGFQVRTEERAKHMDLLRQQVRSVPTGMREESLSRPLAQRLTAPLVGGVDRVARSLTPQDVRRRIARKISLAGNPPGWDADRVAVMKVVGLLAGLVLGVMLTRLATLSGLTSVVVVALVVAIGFAAPTVVLSHMMDKRQREIRKSLADGMDLLTISVEAGLGLNAALLQVSRHVPGSLSEEIGRMLNEMQVGVSRVDAFRQLSERTEVEEIKGFVLAMIQADLFGVSVSKVLRAQSQELRVKRRQRAEQKAMQVPVKLLLPMIFCVMPALFVVIVGPGIIRVINGFFGAGL